MTRVLSFPAPGEGRTMTTILQFPSAPFGRRVHVRPAANLRVHILAGCAGEVSLHGHDRTGAVIAELRIDAATLAFPAMRSFRELVRALDAAKHSPR